MKPFPLGALALTLLLPLAARAQGGMPDLSDFGGAIAQRADAAAPQKIAATPQGGFVSGLAVPRVKPGAASRAVFTLLREKTEAAGAGQPEMLRVVPALKELEKQAPALLGGVEGEILKNGFAPRDMGNAYAFAFLTLRENATGKTTTTAQDKAAGRIISTATAKVLAAKWKTLSPTAKESVYESLVMTTTLNALLIQQFKQAGKTDELPALRQSAADLFEKLVGVPPAQVDIAANGDLSGLAK